MVLRNYFWIVVVVPKLEVSKRDLEYLVGKSFTLGQLENVLEFVKGEVDFLEGDVLRIDCKESNRPDLWSTEGIAREIRARLGIEKGIKKYEVHNGGVSVFVDANLSKIRPLISCAIVKGVTVTNDFIKQIVQLQEKVGEGYGRKRRELGIGLYDFDMMKPPVYYKGFRDYEIEFIPLEWKVRMRPSEILLQHDKGRAYKHLLEGHDLYPIVIDSAGTVASMPPIINSQTTGKITLNTKNIFIECTGFKWATVEAALEVICMALADRGGKIYSCRVHFPKESTPYPAKVINTPSFLVEKISFNKELVIKKTGLKLTDKQMVDLLSKARFNAKIKDEKVHVEYASYRTDILHPVDLIEDLLISYGFNNITPQMVEMSVVGGENFDSRFVDFVRDGCVGLGLQEVLTYNLTSKKIQGENMLLGVLDFVELANPVSTNYEILRKHLAPQLLDFLSKNKDKEFPQKVFEVGSVLSIDSREANGVKQTNNVCVALTHSSVNYTEAKSHLDSLCSYLGAKHSVKRKQFPFFNENSAEIIIGSKKGFIGEVRREVIEAFGLRKPVCLFEFEL